MAEQEVKRIPLKDLIKTGQAQAAADKVTKDKKQVKVAAFNSSI
jgi:hypothetical protein